MTIDARLAFQQPDLNWFTATVEATSHATAEEILYRTNWFRITMLGLVVAFVTTAVTLALSQVLGFNAWRWFATAPGGDGDANTAYGALILVMVMTWAVTSLVLSTRKSFRYIYAVEQFKRFYATAQWMAYDASIFEDRPPRQFEELRRQCILFGFGMLEVLPDNRLRVVIEPSKVDQFAGTRSRLPLWVAAIQAPPKLKSMFQRLPVAKLPFGKRPLQLNPAPAAAPALPTDGTTDPLDVGQYFPTVATGQEYLATAIRAKRGKPAWYKRPGRQLKGVKWRLRQSWRKLSPNEIRRLPGFFQLPTWYYPTLIVAALTTVGFAYGQSQWSPLAKPGSRFAAPDVAGLEPAANPDQSRAEPELLPGEYDHNFSADKPRPEYVEDTPDYVVERKRKKAVRYRISKAGEERTDYDCIGLQHLPSTYYLLTTSVHPNFALARRAADDFHGVYGLAMTVLAEECFRLGGERYFVILDAPILEESQANFMVREYLRRYEIPVEVMVAE
ncbi:hypothetical protein A3850_017655 [Lewinella sp. 4G2]|nr:hypothetical protein A3850_017655 [Lewinella sp. 4G2]